MSKWSKIDKESHLYGTHFKYIGKEVSPWNDADDVMLVIGEGKSVELENVSELVHFPKRSLRGNLVTLIATSTDKNGDLDRRAYLRCPIESLKSN